MQLLDVLVCKLANKSSLAILPKNDVPCKKRWQKGPFLDFEKMVYQLNYRSKCPEVADFCYF